MRTVIQIALGPWVFLYRCSPRLRFFASHELSARNKPSSLEYVIARRQMYQWHCFSVERGPTQAFAPMFVPIACTIVVRPRSNSIHKSPDFIARLSGSTHGIPENGDVTGFSVCCISRSATWPNLSTNLRHSIVRQGRIMEFGRYS
jgi:hypothetical protein